MGHHPKTAAWEASGGTVKAARFKLTETQCAFINDNVGISRRTLRDVCNLFNVAFDTAYSYEAFLEARADAINDGRCRTTYFRNYFKRENSSERQLRIQKPILRSRLVGACQYQDGLEGQACGAETSGRFCETHVRLGHIKDDNASRGYCYIDSSLGKYG